MAQPNAYMTIAQLMMETPEAIVEFTSIAGNRAPWKSKGSELGILK